MSKNAITPLSILILDDEEVIRDALGDHLRRRGHQIGESSTVQDFRYALADLYPDVVILDIRLPDGDGLRLLQDLQEHMPDLPVIMMSGHGTMDDAITSLRHGALDFIRKPLHFRELDAALLRVARIVQAELARDRLAGVLEREHKATSEVFLLGDSPASQPLKDFLDRIGGVAIDGVLITGETGVGKDVFARAIHQRIYGDGRPFVAVNCPALPDNLIESELFGHRKGAFTGAVDDRVGCFELADKGTLFLDEIGDLPLPAQAKLLRALENREVQRIGDHRLRSIHCTVIAATHRDLRAAVAAGTFRQDLLYRLDHVCVHIPPLRERHADIAVLCEHFLKEAMRRYQKTGLQLAPQAREFLNSYEFPGNARQLRHALERAVLFAAADTIDVSDLGLLAPPASKLAEAGAQTNNVAHPDGESNGIREALERHQWNRRKVAEELGLSYEALRWRISKYGLAKPM